MQPNELRRAPAGLIPHRHKDSSPWCDRGTQAKQHRATRDLLGKGLAGGSQRRAHILAVVPTTKIQQDGRGHAR
eukprot:2342808-Pyramimonas_sp.AAC.1